jgi:hypothetical protein
MFDHLNTDNAEEMIEQVLKDWRPDYVHAQFSDKLHPEWVVEMKRKYPAIWTQWAGDARREPIPLVVAFGKVVDATLLASGEGQKELYEQATGKPVFWWQHAVADWQIVTPSEQSGLTMVANHYDTREFDTERWDTAERFSREFPDFRAYGSGWDTRVNWQGAVSWAEQTNIYRSSLITLGPNVLNDIRWYFSDRPLIAMATGVPHLWRYIPGLEELFEC